MLSKIIGVINCSLIFTTQNMTLRGRGRKGLEMHIEKILHYLLNIPVSVSVSPKGGNKHYYHFVHCGGKNVLEMFIPGLLESHTAL